MRESRYIPSPLLLPLAPSNSQACTRSLCAAQADPDEYPLASFFSFAARRHFVFPFSPSRICVCWREGLETSPPFLLLLPPMATGLFHLSIPSPRGRRSSAAGWRWDGRSDGGKKGQREQEEEKRSAASFSATFFPLFLLLRFLSCSSARLPPCCCFASFSPSFRLRLVRDSEMKGKGEKDEDSGREGEREKRNNNTFSS